MKWQHVERASWLAGVLGSLVGVLGLLVACVALGHRMGLIKVPSEEGPPPAPLEIASLGPGSPGPAPVAAPLPAVVAPAPVAPEPKALVAAVPAPVAPTPKPADAAPPAALSPKTWTNSLGMTLVRIEPGEFTMGSTDAQLALL